MATDLGRELAKAQARIHKQRVEIGALKRRLRAVDEQDIKYALQAHDILALKQQIERLLIHVHTLKSRNIELEALHFFSHGASGE